ncbi:MAG TPA: DUF4189 domain-containing protein [Thermoanaerobaculia bacterium]|nr:DUF4189 domain-containing protein [Thermoanaerobaculia bacterium]
MRARSMVVAVVVLLFTSSAGMAQDYDQYGAIAYSMKTKRFGYSTGEGSRYDAEQSALGYCRAADCRIQLWFRNTCAAFATGDNGTITGWGYDSNPRKARQRALNECKKRGSDCRVLVEACTNDE